MSLLEWMSVVNESNITNISINHNHDTKHCINTEPLHNITSIINAFHNLQIIRESLHSKQKN